MWDCMYLRRVVLRPQPFHSGHFVFFIVYVAPVYHELRLLPLFNREAYATANLQTGNLDKQ